MLHQITAFLDDYLRIREIEDYPNAMNGLQIENSGSITRIGAAVDGSEAILQQAADRGIDFLIVHHGLFWAGLAPVAGPQYRKLSLAVKKGIAVYAAHLPLDVHPEIGNNALFAEAIGLTEVKPFLVQRGLPVGCRAAVDLPRAELLKRVALVIGRAPWSCSAGPESCRAIGVVTGAGGSLLSQAANEHIDTFVTGEGPQHTFSLAEELRVNLIYAGHYATETFGVRALAKKVSRKFGLPFEFLDHPSGL